MEGKAEEGFAAGDGVGGGVAEIVDGVAFELLVEDEEGGGDVAVGVGEVGEEGAVEFELADDDLEDGLEDLLEGDGGVDVAAGFEQGLQAGYLGLGKEGFVL